jgi:hypothetical protein
MAASISVFVDPACPWAWLTSRWITEVAPKRELTIRWRSFSPEVRDGGVRLASAIPEHLRQVALERRRIGAVALQVFEWLRNQVGEQAVGRFYTQLGYRLNNPDRPGQVARRCLGSSGPRSRRRVSTTAPKPTHPLRFPVRSCRLCLPTPMRSGCGTRLPPSSRAPHSLRRAAHDRCHSSRGQ